MKVDYIMANPPFNLKDWRGENELLDDPRWQGYEIVFPSGELTEEETERAQFYLAIRSIIYKQIKGRHLMLK